MADAVKRCSKCRIEKLVAEFHWHRDRAVPRLFSYCKECRKEEVRISRYKQVYGITVAEYDAMLLEQGGACAICKRSGSKTRRLDIDHCHRTGKVRGLLCNQCNTVIGKMQDDPLRLRLAAEYLEKRS